MARSVPRRSAAEKDGVVIADGAFKICISDYKIKPYSDNFHKQLSLGCLGPRELRSISPDGPGCITKVSTGSGPLHVACGVGAQTATRLPS